MGPYCDYCGTRCFEPFPKWTPTRIREAYRPSVSIIATCPGGQAYEKVKVGYCWGDIQAVAPDAPVTDFINRVMGLDMFEFLQSVQTLHLERIHFHIAADAEGYKCEGDVAYAHAWQRAIHLILGGRYEMEDKRVVDTAVVPV